MIGNIVDGVIIGRCLGVDSIAAFGIVSPMMVVFSLAGTIVATGSRNCFTRLIGEGKIKEAQNIFSMSFAVSVVAAVVFMLAILIFATPIAMTLGASGNAANLLPKARDYLIGIAFGLPALNAMRVLSMYMPIDNDRQLPVSSSLVLTICDVVFDLIVAFVIHGDTFEIGLATSISQYAAVAVLFLHFGKKNIILRLVPQGRLPWRELGGIIWQGFPIGVCRVGFTLRVAFMNRILAATTNASAAIAAYSVYQQADELLCVLTIGMADTVAVIAGILLGEEDRPRMKRLLLTSVQATLIITLEVSVLFFFIAPYFTSLYISTGNMAFTLATRAVQCYVTGMPLYGLSIIYFNYFQGIGESRLSSVAGFLSEAGVLMLCAWMMSFWFHENAVWYSFPVTQIVMYIYYAVLIRIRSRKNATYGMSLWDRVLLLPKSFDVPDYERVDISVTSMDEVILISEKVESFCNKNSIDKKTAYHLALAIEEMAGNIIKHGFIHDNRKHSIDIRIIKKEDGLILRIRDDCYIFDPVNQLSLFSDEDMTYHIGLRMIFKASKEVKYTSILKLNNLLVRV
ncbi:MAG: ATP-binding protein [Lachnospiraceae bacterium]|nr:ATP-binding protein [Lachnospiraceae bacterium]